MTITPLHLLQIFFSASGLLLVVLSLPLIFEKIPPNGLYGFRVRKTLKNPKLWYKVNTYGGKWLLAAGIGIILAANLLLLIPALTIDVYSVAILVVWIILFGLAVLATVLYMNSR